MLILTGISVADNSISIEDTDRGTELEAPLLVVADKIWHGRVRIVGIEKLNPRKKYPRNAMLLWSYGVAVLPSDTFKVVQEGGS